MSRTRQHGEAPTRETEAAWFWKRLDQASADFDALPTWMKRKDFRPVESARQTGGKTRNGRKAA
jgi:hypothetical protein